MSEESLRFDVLTLFPEMVEEACTVGVLGKALEAGLVTVVGHQLRNYTGGSPHPIDDHPYGGGPGMVMRPQPIYSAVEDVSAKHPPAKRILLSPQGTPLDQRTAERLATAGSVLMLCGRYEGVDERVRPLFDEEISIGDYVLSGGELAALVVIDAVSRLLPGVLGSAESTGTESFTPAAEGMLEYPQYTRPESFRGMRVPSILLSGDHGAIDAWRREQARSRTRERRPDLLPERRGEKRRG